MDDAIGYFSNSMARVLFCSSCPLSIFCRRAWCSCFCLILSCSNCFWILIFRSKSHLSTSVFSFYQVHGFKKKGFFNYSSWVYITIWIRFCWTLCASMYSFCWANCSSTFFRFKSSADSFGLNGIDCSISCSKVL